MKVTFTLLPAALFFGFSLNFCAYAAPPARLGLVRQRLPTIFTFRFGAFAQTLTLAAADTPVLRVVVVNAAFLPGFTFLRFGFTDRRSVVVIWALPTMPLHAPPAKNEWIWQT